MRRTSVPSRITSRPGRLICPMCGSGKLGLRRLAPLASCDSCRCTFDEVVLRILEQIVTLPEVLGKHACECGHPEMRHLPDDTFHCPAFRSEVVHTESNLCALANHAEENEQRRPAGDRRERRPEQG